MSSRSQEWAGKLLDDHWLEEDYVKNLRVSKAIFNQLCGELKTLLQSEDTNKRPAISVKIKVGASLYCLAENCSLRTIANLFGIGRETVRRNIYLFCDALMRLYLPVYINRPASDYLIDVANQFEQRFGIPNCIGAIDGCHIPIICPDREKATDFFCRKQFYSVVLQGIVDSRGVFWNVNVGWPGAVHDARVFQSSSIYKLVNTGNFLPESNLFVNDLHIPYYLVGDEAYPLLEWLMKPFKEVHHLSVEEARYNEGMRVVVEHAFGRLKGRCRRLMKKCDLHLENTKQIVVACCILHDMCDANNVPFLEELVVDVD